MNTLLAILLASQLSVGDVDSKSVTVKRRLTSVEEKAAVTYHPDQYREYMTALLKRHLATKLGPDMKAKLEAMQSEIRDNPERFVQERRVKLEAVETNAVSIGDVKWTNVLDEATAVEIREVTR